MNPAIVMVCGAKFLGKEDSQLAQSWLYTSMNPIFVNSIKNNQFWDKAAQHFNENPSCQIPEKEERLAVELRLPMQFQVGSRVCTYPDGSVTNLNWFLWFQS